MKITFQGKLLLTGTSHRLLVEKEIGVKGVIEVIVVNVVEIVVQEVMSLAERRIQIEGNH